MARGVVLLFPADDLVPVTTSDTVPDPGGPFRGLLISAAGTVRIQTRKNQTRNIPSGGLAVGVIHPIRFSRIHTTGTAATGIFGVPDIG